MASQNDRYYFEKQNSKDCILHSFNNAFGFKAIDKPGLLDYIEQRVRHDMEAGGRGTERDIRLRYSGGKTLFSADVAWDYAQKIGVYAERVRLPGFSTPFLNMKAAKDPAVASHPIVVLGGDYEGNMHAIAIRDGMIYDSERHDEGPRPLTKRELERSIPKVFGAYAFLRNKADARAVRRALDIVGTPL